MCRGGGTSIDLCFANHDVTVSIVETAITDHFTVLCDTQIEMCNIDDNEKCSYRCWKKLKNEQTLLNMNCRNIVETAITDHFTVLCDTQIEMCNIDDNEKCSYRCWKKIKNEQTLLNMNFVLQHE